MECGRCGHLAVSWSPWVGLRILVSSRALLTWTPSWAKGTLKQTWLLFSLTGRVNSPPSSIPADQSADAQHNATLWLGKTKRATEKRKEKEKQPSSRGQVSSARTTAHTRSLRLFGGSPPLAGLRSRQIFRRQHPGFSSVCCLLSVAVLRSCLTSVSAHPDPTAGV